MKIPKIKIDNDPVYVNRRRNVRIAGATAITAATLGAKLISGDPTPEPPIFKHYSADIPTEQQPGVDIKAQPGDGFDDVADRGLEALGMPNTDENKQAAMDEAQYQSTHDEIPGSGLDIHQTVHFVPANLDIDKAQVIIKRQ